MNPHTNHNSQILPKNGSNLPETTSHTNHNTTPSPLGLRNVGNIPGMRYIDGNHHRLSLPDDLMGQNDETSIVIRNERSNNSHNNSSSSRSSSNNNSQNNNQRESNNDNFPILSSSSPPPTPQHEISTKLPQLLLPSNYQHLTLSQRRKLRKLAKKSKKNSKITGNMTPGTELFRNFLDQDDERKYLKNSNFF